MQFKIPVDSETLRVIARLDTLRGAWTQGPGVASDRLDQLRAAAAVQSIGASCRLSGIRISDADVTGLLRDPGALHPERDAAVAYARALDWAGLDAGQPLDEDRLQRLHAIVAGAAPDAGPSPWRTEATQPEAFSPDGRALGRVFTTLPPRLIERTIGDLLSWHELEVRSGSTHPVLAAAVFLLGFVAVSPFRGGNGRVARLLAVRMLERAGYAHVRYASLERVFEESWLELLDAQAASQTRLWSGDAELRSWLGYFLGALEQQLERIERVVDRERQAVRLSPLQRTILDVVSEHGEAETALLLEATGANRNTLKDNMRKLVDAGLVERLGQKRGTRYRLASSLTADPWDGAERHSDH